MLLLHVHSQTDACALTSPLVQKTLTSTLLDYGIPRGHTSMARLVGVPCAIATKLILEGHQGLAKPGILAPYSKEVCDPIRIELEKEGIKLEERYV